MELIGTVVRLQVQRSPLKPGPRGRRVYDPAPLLEVSSLELTPRGVTGDGVLDVHHADHPQSRNRDLRNGLSVMTVSRYEALRARYGAHLVDGVAGESLLLDTDDLADLSGELVLEAADGPVPVVSEAAAPCVEFTRFALGLHFRTGVDDTGPEVQAALAELGGGARGYYLATAGSGRLTRGTRLLRP